MCSCRFNHTEMKRSCNKKRNERLEQSDKPSHFLGYVASTTAIPLIPLQLELENSWHAATVTGMNETENNCISM